MKRCIRKEEGEEKRVKPAIYLKRKLMAALSMLLVAAILLTATSYAWLVLSVAPEVTGITTNVGANGSLEIALLTTETRQDLSKIRTTVGDSLGAGELPSTTANNSWGNLIDLSVKEYGLSDIVLMPARLDIQEKGDGYTLGSGFLKVPSYGYDGRIVKLENNAVGATYSGGKFSYVLGEESYGVRAIGTSNTLTVQESALAMAKSNIKTYTKNANSAAAGALRDNGEDLFGIMVGSMLGGGVEASYDDADLDVLKAIISDLQSSVDYIDSAIRQGIVAVAASRIDDEDTFLLVRNQVINTAKELSEIIADLDDMGEIPDGYNTWIEELSELQNKLNSASIKCDALTDGSYSWDEIKEVMEPLVNTDFVMVNDTWFGDLTMSEATALLGSEVMLTLAPDSGVFADIADYADNYEASVSALGTVVTITTAHPQAEIAYLIALADEVNGLSAAGGAVGGEEVELTTTFGYVLDLAFRCNAANADLLLQTAGIQRVYDDTLAPATKGGGSYMEFATKDSGFPLDKMIELMDAVRVGFVDDQGNLLGVAKLNTSNREVADGVVRAPLYLYNFTIEKEGENQGAMIIGERRKTDNTITNLEQNTAKAVSVVVWLDGDIVDNSKVSATHDASLYGMLNLQFATSADLVPAENGELKNITTSKTSLETVVEKYASVYEAGQCFYTTASWTAFAQAYVYAQAVIEDTNAAPSQIYNAGVKLVKAHTALETISATALSEKLDEFREKYGETDDLARIVVVDKATGYYMAIDPYTQEQYREEMVENGEIYRVNYTKNLIDRGNGVMTSVYTDSSWSVLAAAIYDAEAVNMDPKAGYPQIDAAITALDLAEQALQRKFYFLPYEYNGTLYYCATDDEFKEDTYGRWYDSDFKLITSDLTILTLDAQAEPATIATFDLTSDPDDLVKDLQPIYVRKGAETITPYINLLNKIYPELDKDEIVAINWVYPEQFSSLITQYQVTQLQALVTKANSYDLSHADAEEIKAAVDAAVEKANAVIASTDATADKAAEAAYDLKVAINKAAVYTAPVEDNYITPDQRTVLNIAIETARGISGFDNEGPLDDPEEQAKYDALRTAVADAEDVLGRIEPLATKVEADNALARLNTQLVAFGRKEVNEDNSLPIYIPIGSEIYEVVYATQSPYLDLKTDEEGAFEGELYALILTKNGVVYEAKVPMEVYIKAKEVDIGQDTLNLTDEGTVNLTAALVSDETEENTEEIAEYTWASDNSDIIVVSNAKSAECTLSAKAAGTVNILLTVKTVQGNLYTDSITVTVEPAP